MSVLCSGHTDPGGLENYLNVKYDWADSVLTNRMYVNEKMEFLNPTDIC